MYTLKYRYQISIILIWYFPFHSLIFLHLLTPQNPDPFSLVLPLSSPLPCSPTMSPSTMHYGVKLSDNPVFLPQTTINSPPIISPAFSACYSFISPILDRAWSFSFSSMNFVVWNIESTFSQNSDYLLLFLWVRLIQTKIYLLSYPHLQFFLLWYLRRINNSCSLPAY
jgi:hypothetical protein